MLPFALQFDSRSLSGADVMGLTKGHALAALAALGAGGAGLLLALVLGFTLCGWSGVLLGLACGAAAFASLRRKADALAGLLAGSLAATLVLLGISLQSRGGEPEVQAAITSDASYVRSIAEDIQWTRAAAPVEAGSQSAVPLLPPGIAEGEIPAAVLREAESKWGGMAEAEKQKIREARTRWIANSQSAGSAGNAGPSWLSRLAVAAQASVVALLVASWPALATRYLGWAEN